MKFIVCVKQVPDTTEVEVDRESGTIVREGVPSILNPFDEFALNEALRVRERIDAQIIAVSMGPPQAEQALRKCLAIGADEAILLADRQFAGADTWATSYTLGRALQLMGDIDIVFCGQQAIDGDTAQVGPELAQHLGFSHLTYVEEVEDVKESAIVCRKETDDGYIWIRSTLPVLIACQPTPAFEPKIPRIPDVLKARKKPIHSWGQEDIAVHPDQLGLKGSPTQVIRSYPPPKRGKGIKIQENPEKAAESVVEFLKREGMLG